MRAEDDAPGRLPWRLFWVGLVVRVAYLTLAHTYRIRPLLDHFQFGWEIGRIARALATGYGFADPFEGHSGPTAWNPPVYPLLLGGVFKLFGVYSAASAWVILTINSVFSAATAPAVYEMAERCFKRSTIALWSGWLWALYPAAMQYAVHWVWDMALTACLFAWIVVLALRVRGVGERDPDTPRHQTPARWAAFGVLWGLVGLTNSSLLIVLPAFGVWMIWRGLRDPQERVRLAGYVALAALVCALTLAPWIVRNERVFHAFIPMRANFGAELYESVLPVNEGFPWGGTVPLGVTSPEYLRYRQLGEVGFSREQAARAKAILRAHPGRTLGYVGKRAYMFWFGVPHPAESGLGSVLNEALRLLNFSFLSVAALLGLALMLARRVPGAWLFFWAFALFPVLLYLVTVQARFRHPLEPVMTVLIVYLFHSAERPGRQETAARPGRQETRVV